MHKAHLRQGKTDTYYTVDSDGVVIGENVKHHTYLAASKEQFFLGYVSLLALFYEELTGPEIKVYAYILAHYSFDTTICILLTLKEEISKTIGIKVGTIDNALGGLTRKHLIYTVGKATYKLNPRYAFKGTTGERNKLLKVVLDIECPDC